MIQPNKIVKFGTDVVLIGDPRIGKPLKETSLYQERLARLGHNICEDALVLIEKYINSNLHPKTKQFWTHNYREGSKARGIINKYVSDFFMTLKIDPLETTDNGDVEEISYTDGVFYVTRIKENQSTVDKYNVLERIVSVYTSSNDFSEYAEMSNQFERQDTQTERLLWGGGLLASTIALYFLLRKKT